MSFFRNIQWQTKQESPSITVPSTENPYKNPEELVIIINQKVETMVKVRSHFKIGELFSYISKNKTKNFFLIFFSYSFRVAIHFFFQLSTYKVDVFQRFWQWRTSEQTLIISASASTRPNNLIKKFEADNS